jgi:hypothetical protein
MLIGEASHMPHATSPKVFRGRMERRITQYNNELGGTWRKRVCQEADTTKIRTIAIIAT